MGNEGVLKKNLVWAMVSMATAYMILEIGG